MRCCGGRTRFSRTSFSSRSSLTSGRFCFTRWSCATACCSGCCRGTSVRRSLHRQGGMVLALDSSVTSSSNTGEGLSMSHHYSAPDWGFPHGDARLDFTDLYAFPKPGDARKSILIMNVHPSVHDFLDRENPLGPTSAEPFAPEALYEVKIDTDGDVDIAYRVRFSSRAGGAQTATLRRVEGALAAGTGDGGQV